MLKELKFGTDLTDHIVVDEETEELGASVSDFEAFDNDKNYASYKRLKYCENFAFLLSLV